MSKRHFNAELELVGKTATRLQIPFDVRAEFGTARPPVRGTVNGSPFRSTIAKYGDRYYLGVNREVREGAGARAGETVTVELELDTEAREVEIPGDLAAALAREPAAREAFDRLSYTHRKEYARWITEAKRPETRERRIEKTLAMLAAGETL